MTETTLEVGCENTWSVCVRAFSTTPCFHCVILLNQQSTRTDLPNQFIMTPLQRAIFSCVKKMLQQDWCNNIIMSLFLRDLPPDQKQACDHHESSDSASCSPPIALSRFCRLSQVQGQMWRDWPSRT